MPTAKQVSASMARPPKKSGADKPMSKAAARRKAKNPDGKKVLALEKKLRMSRIHPSLQVVMSGKMTKALRHPANTRGEVSLYNLATADQIHELVYEVGLRGGTKTEMALTIGISYDRFLEWQVQYPEFGEAVELAVMASQVDWESTLRDQAKGVLDGNATAAIFAMKNMFPDHYKDRRDHRIEGGSLVTIDFTGLDGERQERNIPDPDSNNIYEGEVVRG